MYVRLDLEVKYQRNKSHNFEQKMLQEERISLNIYKLGPMKNYQQQ